jgi:2-hydroxy-6-oxonona-2,4-dienedioate hydrolase
MGDSDHVVVFLHGLFGSPAHWTDVMSLLAPHYRVIAPQLPIDHRSDRRKNGVTSIRELTEIVEGMLDGLGLKRFVLCGNSLGGLIAIDYALQHPERVRGLVLAGSAGLYERSLTQGVRPQATREFVRTVIEDIFHAQTLITDSLIDDWYASISDRDYARFILRISRATRDRCVEEELCKIQAPTLIIWGSNDKITPPYVGEQFRDRIAGATLQFIDECGHSPNLEQPHAFGNLIETFLPGCFASTLLASTK